MTSTLYFYKLPINLYGKNFVLDSIETYLATLTPVTKTKFQYQRFELEKTIKVNMSQDYQLNISSLTKYNFLKITSLDESNNTATYYYIIKSARQISQSTIEFDIVMDTLNTFKFVTSSPNPSNYTLSKKTLVTREHKDRFASKNERVFGNLMEGFDPVNEVGYLLDLEYIENNFLPNTPYTYNFSRYTIFDVHLINISNIELIYENVEDIEFTYIPTPIPVIDITLTYHDGTTETTNVYIDKELYLVFRDSSFDKDSIFSLLYETNAKPFKDVRRRIVNEYQEGLATTLFKKTEQSLQDDDENNQWYVAFASTNAISGSDSVSSVKYVNPVQIRFYSDKGYSINTSLPTEKKLEATSPKIPQWVNSYEMIEIAVYGSPRPNLGEKYVKINGTTYDFHDYGVVLARRKNNKDAYFDQVEIYDLATPSNIITLHNVEALTIKGFNSLPVYGQWYNVGEIYIGSNGGTYSGSCPKWEDVDLTNPKLIKAFAFPFAPCEFLVGQSSFTSLPEGFIFNVDNFIEMIKPQANIFNYNKQFDNLNPQKDLLIKAFNVAYGQARNIRYESKLFHSDYYQPKFVYDSFSFSFNLENINIDSYLSFGYFFENLIVNYVVSRNVQSKFLFQFPQYTLKRSIQDYDNVLCIERNNEKALFNNAYINYIRSGGYSYDTKKAASQNAVNGITTAFSIIGAIGSFATTPYTGFKGVAAGVGLTLSAISSITRSVHTAQEQDRAIAQKINQQMMQGTSVQGSEDIDILTAFSGNKPKLVYYELSDIMKQAMWDLFHYCGYATHEQKIPVTNSRIYFNFIQADIVLKDYTFNETIANDIIAKWKQGVTFMHLVSATYDFDQAYENFETSLI